MASSNISLTNGSFIFQASIETLQLRERSFNAQAGEEYNRHDRLYSSKYLWLYCRAKEKGSIYKFLHWDFLVSLESLQISLTLSMNKMSQNQIFNKSIRKNSLLLMKIRLNHKVKKQNANCLFLPTWILVIIFFIVFHIQFSRVMHLLDLLLFSNSHNESSHFSNSST